jgi:NAD(P)-dependent dehydrogenase (short-subunit alcohol dehydrogenase family)
VRLQGKVAFVSGSTRGIGRTITELFAAEGAKVVVSGRTTERGLKGVERIKAAGGEAMFVPLDVGSEDSVRAAIAATAERYGAITTLINNATPSAILNTRFKPMVDYSTDEWDEILRLTLTGPVFWACKYAIPYMISHGGGSIVNISTGSTVFGAAGTSAYTAAKGGMNAVTRTIAVEYAPYNIRCNAIIVGRVVSHPNDQGPMVPGLLTRVGRPSDIANAALWLAADESEFVTGSLVTVDGGQSINNLHTTEATSSPNPPQTES